MIRVRLFKTYSFRFLNNVYLSDLNKLSNFLKETKFSFIQHLFSKPLPYRHCAAYFFYVITFLSSQQSYDGNGGTLIYK